MPPPSHKTHPVDHHVGLRLRSRRQQLGITQSELAHSVSVSFQQIQKYERGTNRISASMLWELSKSLKVEVEFFFEGLKGRDRLILIPDPPEALANAYARIHDPALKDKAIEILKLLAK